MLGKIETYGDNGHVDGPPVCGDSAPTTLWHFDAGGSGRPHHHFGKSVDSSAAKTGD